MFNGIKESMHKTRIVVFVPTLTSGGAEKQAMILAHVLKFEYTTFLVVWDGRKVEAKFKQYIDQNKIEYCFLCGSIFIRFIKLLLFLKRNKISIIFNFLASSNFYGTIAGKLKGVIPATTPSGCRIDQLSTFVPTFSENSPLSKCGIPHANSTTSSPLVKEPLASS